MKKFGHHSRVKGSIIRCVALLEPPFKHGPPYLLTYWLGVQISTSANDINQFRASIVRNFRNIKFSNQWCGFQCLDEACHNIWLKKWILRDLFEAAAVNDKDHAPKSWVPCYDFGKANQARLTSVVSCHKVSWRYCTAGLSQALHPNAQESTSYFHLICRDQETSKILGVEFLARG